MQPILPTGAATTTRTATRRGGIVSYVDPGSGDEEPDAGAIDSDDSDFATNQKMAARQSGRRMGTGMSVFHAGSGVSTPQPQPTRLDRPDRAEIEQSYLGMVPPARFIKPRPMTATAHEYP